jgi:phosphate transport system protein
MAARIVFEEKLNKLNDKIMMMARMVENILSETITAVIECDRTLAKKIMNEDTIINDMQIRIEKESALIIGHYQPVAKDLRFIIGSVKIVTDLERIADQCADICEYSIMIQDGTWNREEDYKRHIEKMALDVKEMMHKALNAYVTKDENIMREVCRHDDVIDNVFIKIRKELIEKMKNDLAFVENGVDYVMIIKYLERIADHITNIVEWTLYTLSGEYKLHQDI